ncbi:uncharacterized protein LOC122663014 [Telopea speciosissima]|uniref:uncharacterized protein LOC122663014 n=1 Tax=Telopea speciosissima TaxID=54955 RepID=UPI001CC5F6C7|nr:uncharacterized protein LOC122663014 [Telopea speciosissima]
MVLDNIQNGNFSRSCRMDRLVCMPTSDGKLSVKSFWNKVRLASPERPLAKWLWNWMLPSKIGFFTWQVLCGSIPTDDAIMAMGIPFVSKCLCFCSPVRETTTHCMVVGGMASKVWDFFLRLVDIELVPTQDVRCRILFWHRHAHGRGHGRVINGLLPSFIVWELWKERNNRKHGERALSASHIVEVICNWVREIPFLPPFRKLPNPRDSIVPQFFGITQKVAPSSSDPVFLWPPFTAVKLNIDGACKGNSGEGGGGDIIRDNNGSVIVAFAKYYGAGTNNIAEVRALRDGLRLCANLGLVGPIVNSNSEVILRCVSKRRYSLWKGWYWFQEIMDHIESTRPLLSFTFREGNKAADWLANLAYDSASDIYFSGEMSLPLDLRWITSADALGLPVLRN